MLNNLKDWEMLARLFEKIADSKEDLDGRAVELAVGLKLADMVKNRAVTIAAVTGNASEAPDGYNYQLLIARKDGNQFFMIFPSEEIAAKTDMGYIECSLEQILRLVSDTPQIRGIQFIIDVNNLEKHDFFTGLITKNMVAIALGV